MIIMRDHEGMFSGAGCSVMGVARAGHVHSILWFDHRTDHEVCSVEGEVSERIISQSPTQTKVWFFKATVWFGQERVVLGQAWQSGDRRLKNPHCRRSVGPPGPHIGPRPGPGPAGPTLSAPRQWK